MSLLSTRRSQAPPVADGTDRAAVITALYREHALGLTRLAYVMLGDRAAAEDVVHDAYMGLHRRWSFLADPGKAQTYLRSSVLNGCRSALRRAVRTADSPRDGAAHADSPEDTLLVSERRTAMIKALRALPARQREVLVLRFYLDLSHLEIAHVMGIRESTARSTAHRGLTALESILARESS